MPTPGQQSPLKQSMPSALQKMWEQSEPDLVHEVSELRKEIAALRAELATVPPLIVTGRQALDEFKRLAHANHWHPDGQR